MKLKKIYKGFRRKRFITISHLNDNFLNEKKKAYEKDLKEIKIANSEKIFDFFLIGSDEIWNLGNTGIFPYLEFFGIGRQDFIKIAYAPSISGYSKSKFLKDKRRVKAIKELDNVFPRDIMTKLLVDEIRDESSSIVVDPTLLIDDWGEYIKDIKIEKNYILYYGYYPTDKIISNLRNFANENNLIIVTPNFNYSWSDLSISSSPLEFLSLVRDAKFIITDTFHGTVFSSIFKKKFISIKRSPKVYDFLSRHNGDKNLVDQNDLCLDLLQKYYLTAIENRIFYHNLEKSRVFSRDLLINSLA